MHLPFKAKRWPIIIVPTVALLLLPTISLPTLFTVAKKPHGRRQSLNYARRVARCGHAGCHHVHHQILTIGLVAKQGCRDGSQSWLWGGLCDLQRELNFRVFPSFLFLPHVACILFLTSFYYAVRRHGLNTIVT